MRRTPVEAVDRFVADLRGALAKPAAAVQR